VTLDLIVAFLLIFFCIAGALSGALAQGAHLAAVIASGMFGRPVGALLAPAVGDALGVPKLVANIAATSLAFLCLYVGLHLLGKAVARRLTRDGNARAVDRALGAVLGSAKTLLIVWVLLSGLVFLEKPIGGFSLGWSFDGKGSFFAAMARDHNFFSVDLPAAPSLPRPRG
jgi:membrane protein required for colicin V production